MKDLVDFEYAGARVTVMGLGRFGGGIGVSRWLVEMGSDVMVTDLLSSDDLSDSLASLEALPIEYRLGEHNVSDFTDTDLIVANPAVDRRQNRFLRAAEAAGIPITTEIEILLSQLNRQRIIAITGSAGKSTTTAMLTHTLRALLGKDRVFMGGNIGGSLLGSLDQINEESWVVLEMSSFMTEPITGWSPAIALVTNLSPNHLDRHGNMEQYAKAKQNLITGDSACDLVLLGETVSDWRKIAYCKTSRVISELHDGPLSIPGAHNRLNASFVLEVIRYLDLDEDTAVKALSGFAGLPHRMQLVAEHNGLRFFNDSKSTTPASALLAMQSFPSGVCHVILGGYDKGADLSEMARFAAEHCAGVYCIGATSTAISNAAKTSTDGGPSVMGSSHIFDCEDLSTAFEKLAPRLRKEQVLLLSPGCASLDQFKNYEARAAQFTAFVLKICSESGLEFSSTQ